MEYSEYASPSATLKNLRRLFWLRNVMIVFLSSTALALLYLNIPLHALPIVTAVSSMLALNTLTWLRLRRHGNVGEGELLVQLLGDIATLTALFYFTGGYSNPFVWMYLLPLSIAAVALRTAYVWLIAALAVGCYSALVFYYEPLSHLHLHSQGGAGLDIHLVGMWLGFVVCACMIAVFVARIGQNLREYDRLIAETREKALESERMLALGTLATAAAHELGTPLATMAVVAGEMAADCTNQPQLSEQLALLRSQIDRCKQILTSITASAGQQRAEDGQGQALDDFLRQTLARWRDTRPAIQVTCLLQDKGPTPAIAVDRTLGQALSNLLDNAADASPEGIEVSCEWDNSELRLDIRDHGPGLAPDVAEKAGTPFFTTKQAQGMGLGLYLARMIFERFGGSVRLGSHPQGGTLTQVRLPLNILLIKEA
jgi:two-component system, sensor histidine kinase RegB